MSGAKPERVVRNCAPLDPGSHRSTQVPRDLSVPRPLDLPTTVPLDPTADLAVLDEAKIFAAPDDPADVGAWRAALLEWRTDTRHRIEYDGRSYDTGTRWAADCYAPCLVWLWDERLYDRDTGAFTVEAFVEAGRRDFGGFDAVVLWHAYPVIGVDERNQWDYYRDVPQLADVIERFQRLGLKVFCDYNPWDVGTRRADRDDPAELAALVGEYGFDGVFLDTLKEGAPELLAALRADGDGIPVEGESRVPLASIADHALSWAQWFADSDAPGVLRARWFERRHMMHHIRRWNRDHSAELQSAWVNGCGVLVWDDVFGVWVGWNARDRATLRAMLPVLRALGEVFRTGEWTPLAELHPHHDADVHAHRYELGGVTVWALINRGANAWRGPVLTGPNDGRWWDVTSGRPIEVVDGAAQIGIPGWGIAGLVRVAEGARLPSGESARTVIDQLTTQAQTLAASSDSAFPTRAARAVKGHAVAPLTDAPADTVTLTRGEHRLHVAFRVRETAQADETPWIDAWKPLPPELHAIAERTDEMTIGAVAMDLHEVTNRQYAAFVAETGYAPRVLHRFLQHGNGIAPDDDEPVAFVDLDDARAFATWHGGRLPTPAEWQLAIDSCGAQQRAPRVWNWTDSERTDGATRYALLKGGSAFRAEGSDWYVDGAPQQPSWELKLVLPGGGLQRSSRIGFRCAYDLAEVAE